MINLSSLLGSPLLCLASSCISGSVADVYFDEYCKKAVYFCIENADSSATPHLLPIEEASSVSDAVVIKDEVPFISPADVDLTAMHSGLKDMAVYTQSGALKGAISNVLFTNTGKVVKFVLPDGEFTPQAILSVREVMILKSAIKGKSAVKKRTIPRPKKDYPVHILNEESSFAVSALDKTSSTSASQSPLKSAVSSSASIAAKTIEQVPTLANTPITVTKPIATMPTNSAVEVIAKSVVEVPTKPVVALSTDKREPVLSNGAFQVILDGSEAYSYDNDARTPTRIICDYEFLLGRTLGADLRTYTGELIANEGSVVTDMIVDKARRAGKLVELTLNSVKPTSKN